jgi:hypothetical protein
MSEVPRVHSGTGCDCHPQEKKASHSQSRAETLFNWVSITRESKTVSLIATKNIAFVYFFLHKHTRCRNLQMRVDEGVYQC